MQEEKEPKAEAGNLLDIEVVVLEAEAAPDPVDIEKERALEKEKKEREEERKRLAVARGEFFGLLKAGLSPLPVLLCPNWGIQEEEVDALCDAYAAALAKYFPSGVGEMGELAGAVLATLAVVGPRLSKPPRLREKQVSSQGVLDDSSRD